MGRPAESVARFTTPTFSQNIAREQRSSFCFGGHEYKLGKIPRISGYKALEHVSVGTERGTAGPIANRPNGGGAPFDRASEVAMSEAVQTHAGIDEESTATDQGRDSQPDSCSCTPLMPCWECTRSGRRGRPAVRRVT